MNKPTMPTKDQILDALEKLGLSLRLSPGDRRQELFLTPYPGARGTAGVAVAWNGTPPRAHFIMVQSGSFDSAGYKPLIFDVSGYRARRIRQSEKPAYKVLRDAFNHLIDTSEPVKL
jgi:hypothetical protein